MSPDLSKAVPSRRNVCDHCRRRRIRCDGLSPCNQCVHATLNCKRDYIPKKRGPKRGSGRVINELRVQDGGEMKGELHESALASSTGHGSMDGLGRWMSNSTSSPTSATFSKWHPIRSDASILTEEPASIFTTDQFRPNRPNYFHLIPTCIDLFEEHIYPIMPLLHIPTLREFLNRPLEIYEKNLLYALCALTSTHMSGKNILAPGPPSWEVAGRFFLDECILVRQSYDFVEDRSLSAVISSYLVSTAFFELNQSRKSWYYLREAMTMGQDLGLHNEYSYIDLAPAEALCRRRTFWILYVTERSFAILRHKPLTISKMPSLPTTAHDYESPEIHSGFMHLIHFYHLLNSSFVDSWNKNSSAPASSQTYTLVQQQLNLPHPSHISLTTIQKADIFITQQWLRLIVWQSSMHQGLLSSTSADESMTFRYPLTIAHSLLNIISSLPETSIEVHGMGIFEKIFEIGNSMLDVMQVYGPNMRHENYGVVQDPFCIFVRTLSQSPNSQRQFADFLLQKAEERPEILRWSGGLMPTISDREFDLAGDKDQGLISRGRGWRGSIVGEITEASDNGTTQDDSDHSWTILTEPPSPLENAGEILGNTGL